MKDLLKQIQTLISKELLKLDIDEISKEIDDLLGRLDYYSVHIGVYHHLSGFREDNLDDNDKKLLMSFDGKSLLNYLIDYTYQLEYYEISRLIIAFLDDEGNFEVGGVNNEFYIEFNGHDLHYDYA
jgi:CRISPR/Cas system-associated protein Cas5 (RAMP superfamily)